MESARVQSIDALKTFRLSLWKFAEVAARVLTDADGEMQRMRIWLETEQQSYWRGQIQKRSELVTRARDAMLSRKLYKNVDGTHPSAVEEEKALKLAVQRLEEANQKFNHVRRYMQHLQKQILLYQAQVQQLANAIQVEVPMAAGRLEDLVTSLEAYVAGGMADRTLAASEPAPSGPVPSGETEPSMARPEPPPPPPELKPHAANADEAGADGAKSDQANRQEAPEDASQS
jgi:hypothetical protein